MADPGTLIPSDATGSHIDYDESSYVASPSSRDLDSSHVASSSSGVGSSYEETSDLGWCKWSLSLNFTVWFIHVYFFVFLSKFWGGQPS